MIEFGAHGMEAGQRLDAVAGRQRDERQYGNRAYQLAGPCGRAI
jgi:uncharacterized protein YoaH (UPF0181 family)